MTGSNLVASAVNGDLDWPQFPSYTPDPSERGRKPLTAISFSDTNNGHAVGHYLTNNTGGLWQTQAQRWNGTNWVGVPSYNHPGVSNFLYGVVAVSSNDGWAVGTYENSQGSPLILRYVAGSWVNWPVTVPSSTRSVLSAVTANSPSDVWAVGYYLPAGSSTYRTLVMHWNGLAWNIDSSPNMGLNDNKLFGVTQVPDNPYLFWAVGTYVDKDGNLKILTMQADVRRAAPGSIWSIVPGEDQAGVPNCLRSVSALDSNNIWAVGFTDNRCADEASYNESTAAGSSDLLTQKWDGSRWVEESSELGAPGGINTLYGVSVASNSRVWAVGYYEHGTGWATMVLGRESSGLWKQHCSANPSGTLTFDQLLAVDALSDTFAWAAGWFYKSAGGDKPTLIEHYMPPDCYINP